MNAISYHLITYNHIQVTMQEQRWNWKRDK